MTHVPKVQEVVASLARVQAKVLALMRLLQWELQFRVVSSMGMLRKNECYNDITELLEELKCS